MELSKQKQTEAKKLNVTVQYLVMADLMSIGYSEQLSQKTKHWLHNRMTAYERTL